MHWLKKAILCAAASVVSVSASAQEPAVRLGAPIPLSASRVEIPPPPRVIRAAGPIMDDDERRLFLPREVPAVDESKLLWPIAPTKKFERITQPLPGADEKSKPRDPAKPDKTERLDKADKTTRTDKEVIVASSPLPSSMFVSKETIIIVDEKGNPIPDYNVGGPNRFYASGEWLLWWTRGFHLPPLVTTASPFDPERTRGALGSGSTQLLFGDNTTSTGPTSGARFTLGYNLDPCGLCAIEGSFFFLTRKNNDASFSNDVLARPFFNLNEGHEDRELTTSPALLPGDVFKAAGTIHVDTSSRFLGAEANVRKLWCCSDNCLVTALVGFRYLHLNESLNINENFVVMKDIPNVPPSVPIFAGDQISVFDSFSTHNNFYGGQIGATAEWQLGRWTVMSTAKIALGATVQSVDIDGGQQILSKNGNVQNFTGGLLAVSSNIGHHTQSRLAFVPELGVKVGYNVRENIRVFVGYDFLFWSSVLRPGDQIDRVLDLNLVPNSGGPFPTASQVRPVVPFQTSSFWAQGVNAGIMIRY